MRLESNHHPKHLFSVSALSADIKNLLENRFPFVWVYGEISNVRRPGSGHLYFTLKDENAQLNGVMFRSQNQSLKFELEDGLSITGFGRISVYEPRGTYQIILEYAEPKGIGDLQKAFEQLKLRLNNEGLFDDVHKKPIPFLPRHISVITSPSGAVIHDIVQIVLRRFPGIHIRLLPVKVQGVHSEIEIADAIEWLNQENDTDVAILARGGGSLEDLYPFNTELVPRSIFASKIPIISAIGHETDYTIADFTADLRAPTPSAAAELVVPEKKELLRRSLELSSDLKLAIEMKINFTRECFKGLTRRLVHPQHRVDDFKIRMDETSSRLNRWAASYIQLQKQRNTWLLKQLFSN
jgi:exodeoxyribonuclease VII large subunit